MTMFDRRAVLAGMAATAAMPAGGSAQARTKITYWAWTEHVAAANAVSLTLAWAMLILVLCAMPGRYFPEAGWLALLKIDKVIHAFMFFVLAVLIVLASSRRAGSRSAC